LPTLLPTAPVPVGETFWHVRNAPLRRLIIAKANTNKDDKGGNGLFHPSGVFLLNRD
jgi:hypothetical protein